MRRQRSNSDAQAAAYDRYHLALAALMHDGSTRAVMEETRAAFRAWASLLIGRSQVPEWDDLSAMHAAYGRRRRGHRARRRRR